MSSDSNNEGPPSKVPEGTEEATTKEDTAKEPDAGGSPAEEGSAAEEGNTDGSAKRKPRQRVTIKTVAEAAGVSIATVSFVLNNRPGQTISAPVRKRVLETAKRLNYAPSAAAAGLARKQTTNVAICFYRNEHLITNQLYSYVVQGAIKAAIAREYNVLFSFIRDEYQNHDDLPKVVREKNAEGALFIQSASEAMVRELDARGIQVVSVDSHPAIANLDVIYADNDLGARLACRHLVDLGHRQVAFLFAHPDRPSIKERAYAFADEMTKLGLPRSGKGPLLEAEGMDFDAGVRRMTLALDEQPELTGIFCANDELAASVIRAASKMGRRVPDDLSVIGFDDLFMARCMNPPVSTVRYDAEEMGKRAMSRLIDMIENKGEKRGILASPPERMPVEVLKRGSTGPAPKR